MYYYTLKIIASYTEKPPHPNTWVVILLIRTLYCVLKTWDAEKLHNKSMGEIVLNTLHVLLRRTSILS